MKKLAIFLTIVILGACANAKEQCDTCEGGVIKGTNTAVVKISLDKEGNPSVDTDPVIVEVGQRLVWAGPEEITIRFPEGSPFKTDKLNTRSAVINELILEPSTSSFKKSGEQRFKYDVIVGKKILDPIVIVREPK